MMNYAETASISTNVPVTPLPQSQCQEHASDHISAVPSYAIGPIDPSRLIAIHAPCSNGEECPLLIPKQFPLWILNHPEFRDGCERNFFTEEEGANEEWGTVSRMVNLIYSKLLGQGFEDFPSGEVEPNFGAWEIGWLLRDFTRLADTDRVFALTGIAHLCFLVSFLPVEQPVYWPPVGLVWTRWRHDDAVKAYRAQVCIYREQGKSYDEAQRLALCQRH